MNKLKIDITNGIVEVEGDDAFVSAVYNDYKQIALSRLEQKSAQQSLKSGTKKEVLPDHKGDSKGVTEKKRKGANTGAAPSVLQDFEPDLSAGSPKLVEFFKERNPGSAFEKNVVFVTYMQDILRISTVTVDHVYTCYRFLGERPPAAFRQSILDTASKKFWLNTTDMQNIKVSEKGRNFVMFELTGRTKAKSIK